MPRVTFGILVVVGFLGLGSAAQADCERCYLGMFGWACSDLCEGKTGYEECDIIWYQGEQYCLNGDHDFCTGSAECPGGNCNLVELCEPENKPAFFVAPNGEASVLDWASPDATPSGGSGCRA